ncbi:MAG: histidine phosphatase family protein [Myxococcaceae bacterium]
MFYLVRHGETAWSLTGQHTGLTDLHLTDNGRAQAKALKSVLKDLSFSEIWCSPLIRAAETCELTGFGERAETLRELTEWNYGQYEGITSAEIKKKQPDWNVFEHGAPGGESPKQVQARIQVILTRMNKATGNVLIFSSAHILRALTACFLGQKINFGKHLSLNTTSLSILGYEHQAPAIKMWNRQ